VTAVLATVASYPGLTQEPCTWLRKRRSHLPQDVKSLCRRNFAGLIPEWAALTEFGYEDRQKLTLVVEELGIATVTPSHLYDGDVAPFVTSGVQIFIVNGPFIPFEAAYSPFESFAMHPNACNPGFRSQENENPRQNCVEINTCWSIAAPLGTGQAGFPVRLCDRSGLQSQDWRSPPSTV